MDQSPQFTQDALETTLVMWHRHGERCLYKRRSRNFTAMNRENINATLHDRAVTTYSYTDSTTDVKKSDVIGVIFKRACALLRDDICLSHRRGGASSNLAGPSRRLQLSHALKIHANRSRCKFRRIFDVGGESFGMRS